ncbi:cyanophycinase [Kordia sp. SMS9]|uniref:cyanophycinase n=1 Tax=Kordia sp. SMS9 TaxID=2282170 RepID=UPI000E0DCFFA|nr:cyanophycinase [Kordia sp. SMS9]AXG70285.1 cyanophycinase [Kordia sp. SMS9]
MKKTVFIFILLFISIAQAQKTAIIPAKGPEKGTLFLIGGGISETQARLFEKFAGGKDAPIVIIPTAMSDNEIAKNPDFSRIKKRFQKLGITNISILHTRNTKEANSDAFVAPLKTCQGVFILGGKTQRITDAYHTTKVHKELKALLNRDGIIAGVSAGSGVQASYFYEHHLQTGFDFLEGVIIMNHFLARNKQFNHIQEIKENTQRIAIGIDNGTGILVQKNVFEVVGNSYVAMFDGSYYDSMNDTITRLPANSERFYLLKNGDRYNLEKRSIETNSGITPIELSDEELQKYTGIFKATNKDFSIKFLIENNTLKVKNSWGWNVYPIYPLKKDTFFATNRTMWFQFVREKGKIVAVKKIKSILQDNVIVTLERQK